MEEEEEEERADKRHVCQRGLWTFWRVGVGIRHSAHIYLSEKVSPSSNPTTRGAPPAAQSRARVSRALPVVLQTARANEAFTRGQSTGSYRHSGNTRVCIN